MQDRFSHTHRAVSAGHRVLRPADHFPAHAWHLESRRVFVCLAIVVLAGLLFAIAPGLFEATGLRKAGDTREAAPTPPAARAPGTQSAAGAVQPTLAEIETQIAELARSPPRYFDARQARYRQSTDLYGMLMDLVPAAARGEGAAQYHIYLALQECRAYLGPNGEATLEETTLTPFWRSTQPGNGETPVSGLERELWLDEYHRCKNFVGASLVTLETAMANEAPGDVTEYGAVWFERSFQAGYPLALVNMALRLSTLSDRERQLLLRMATRSGDPLVFLSLFENAWITARSKSTAPHAAAWLVLACRAGLDCSAQAYWYQSRICASEWADSCQPGETAIGHFWSQLRKDQKHRAYRRAQTIAAQLEAGDLRVLP